MSPTVAPFASRFDLWSVSEPAQSKIDTFIAKREKWEAF